MITVSGKDFKAFYNDTSFWPEVAWHQDERITVDGVVDDGGIDLHYVKDLAVVTLEGGEVLSDEYWIYNGYSIEDLFVAWQELRTHKTVIVNIPKDRLGQFSQLVQELGGRVIT